MRFDDQNVVVAGGGSGIGQATALLFSSYGAKVVAADRNLDGARETVELIQQVGGEATAVQFDITSRADNERLVQEAVAAFGPVSVMASTVGWSDTTFFADEDEDYWDRIIRINLLGSIYFSRAAFDHMKEHGKGGAIVLTSSDAGKVGTLGETVYAAAKAGVIGFVKSLARETARDNIRVNAISPGPTDTPLLRAQSDQHVIDRMIKAVPLKRMGTADEQAAPIVFLASAGASYITGQTLSVSGGLTMTS
ncbi:MAG: SDR family oxidoreductase [Cryobacterium sp.]|nr:SDR family oxidoreductase [Cryobacterium sp.]